MKKLNFIEKNKQVTESEISNAEKMIGVVFPSDYRAFLLSDNGGLATECIFEVPDYGQSSIVFYGIETGEEYSDLYSSCEAYKARLPDKVVPIGFDPGSNLICIYIEDGSIWYWDHEKENDPPTLSNMKQLQPSFADFVDSLEYEDNEDW